MRASLRLILGLVALSGCAGARTSETAPLRVVSVNIHAGKDAVGGDNLERLADFVRRERPDVVLLQEVDVGTTRSGGVDQPAVLERLTGYHAAFGKTLDYQGGQYGIAILSRWPIARHALRHLPIDPPQARAGGSTEPRGALIAEVAAPTGRITVVNTHLDATSDRYRRQEMATLTAVVDSLRRAGHRRLLVGGDVNSEPGSGVDSLARAAGWTDAWTACGDGSAGLTFPARRPVKRIDVLWFTTGAVGCARASVPVDTLSDHRALVVDGVRW